MPYRLAIFAVCLLAVACTSTVPVRSPLVQMPLVDMSPIAVAIRYTDGLTHHRCVADKGYVAEAWTIELGAPSIAMFDKVFMALFAKTVAMGQGQTVAVAAEPLPVIEVGLLSYDGCQASWPIVGTTSVKVAYEATLFGKDGARVAHWQGRGRAGAEDFDSQDAPGAGGWDIEGTYLADVTRLAMRKAAADFLINYDKNPAVRAWLKSQ